MNSYIFTTFEEQQKACKGRLYGRLLWLLPDCRLQALQPLSFNAWIDANHEDEIYKIQLEFESRTCHWTSAGVQGQFQSSCKYLEWNLLCKCRRTHQKKIFSSPVSMYFSHLLINISSIKRYYKEDLIALASRSRISTPDALLEK